MRVAGVPMRPIMATARAPSCIFERSVDVDERERRGRDMFYAHRHAQLSVRGSIGGVHYDDCWAPTAWERASDKDREVFLPDG